MTLQQTAYEKINALPEEDLRLIVVIADKMIKRNSAHDGDHRKADVVNMPLLSDGDKERYREILASLREEVERARVKDGLSENELMFYEGLEQVLDAPFSEDLDYEKAREESLYEKFASFA